MLSNDLKLLTGYAIINIEPFSLGQEFDVVEIKFSDCNVFANLSIAFSTIMVCFSWFFFIVNS